jgi:hypothetical protein
MQWRSRGRRRAGGMLGLRRGGGYGTLAQLLPRSFTSPCTRIDIAYRAQPFFGFGQRREITHVKSESLTAFLKTPADEKTEAFELRLFRFRERHGRRGGTQVEYVWTRIRRGRSGLFNRIMACCPARCRLRRWCHRIFPGPMRKAATRGQEETPDEEGSASVRAKRDRGSPAVIGTPSFRPVALRPRLSTGLPLSLQYQVSKRRL